MEGTLECLVDGWTGLVALCSFRWAKHGQHKTGGFIDIFMSSEWYNNFYVHITHIRLSSLLAGDWIAIKVNSLVRCFSVNLNILMLLLKIHPVWIAATLSRWISPHRERLLLEQKPKTGFCISSPWIPNNSEKDVHIWILCRPSRPPNHPANAEIPKQG